MLPALRQRMKNQAPAFAGATYGGCGLQRHSLYANCPSISLRPRFLYNRGLP